MPEDYSISGKIKEQKMRNLLLCCFFTSLFFISCNNQDEIGTNTQAILAESTIGDFYEFMGLNFQMNQYEAKNTLTEKDFEISTFTRNRIRAVGNFENRSVDIELRFFEDKLYSGRIGNQGWTSEEENNLILVSLIEKFGDPDESSMTISSWYFDNDKSLTFLRGAIAFANSELRNTIRAIEPIYIQMTGGVFLYSQTPFNELGIILSHHRRDDLIGIANFREDLHNFSIVINARTLRGVDENFYFRPATPTITSVLRRADVNNRFFFSLYAFYTAFGGGLRWNRHNEINYISVFSREGSFTTRDGENTLFIFP